MGWLQKALLILLVMFLNTGYAATDVADEAIAAKWESHQIRFHYAGFTSKYSCDGIRGKVKLVLRAIGARKDIEVQGSCFGGFSEVQPSHNLRLAFAAPVPADPMEINEETFPARWQKVRLGYNHPRDLDQGDCELVEQLSTQVLSKINLRDLDDKSNCIPHQRKLGSPNLTGTFLIRQEPEVLENTDKNQ